MKYSLYVMVIVIMCFITGCATAQRGAIIRAYSGIQNKEYDFALNRLSEAENYADPSPEIMAQILYLKGICFEGLNKTAEAKGTYKYLMDTIPKSQYAYMARERLSSIETIRILEGDVFNNKKKFKKTEPLTERNAASLDQTE